MGFPVAAVDQVALGIEELRVAVCVCVCVERRVRGFGIRVCVQRRLKVK